MRFLTAVMKVPHKFCLLHTAIFLLAPSSALSQFHAILGTNSGWDGGVVEIISEIEISGLRIRHARRATQTCAESNQVLDHVEMSGPINPDTPEVIERLIDRIKRNPNRCRNPETGNTLSINVFLNSGGGYMEDGFRLAELFREKDVSTVIPTNGECYSSCATAFLGGLYRRMGEGSRLLFHAPYRYLNRYDIVCESSSRRLRNFFRLFLNRRDGQFLYERTMSYCSTRSGWTLNPGAAEIFNITTS